MSLSNQSVSYQVAVYSRGVPKLWKETIEAHRREVGDAILDTTAALVREHGLRAVTMSQIAEQTGIGRATLYKYYPDVEAILVAWHERNAGGHLAQLAELRERAADSAQALEAVLETLALHMAERSQKSGGDLVALVHQDKHVSKIEQQMHRFLADLIGQASKAGQVRTDIPPDELATYCLHALTAAGAGRSKASVQRLVAITLSGLEAHRYQSVSRRATNERSNSP
jgi:AcrR family transcriptional regulator